MICGFLQLTHLNNENPMFLRMSSILRIVVRDDGATAIYTADKNEDNRPRYHLVKETPDQIGKLVAELVNYDTRLYRGSAGVAQL